MFPICQTSGSDVNGERRRGPGGSIVASVIPGGHLSAERTRAAAWEDTLPGSWDPHARIKVLDEESIDAAFLSLLKT